MIRKYLLIEFLFGCFSYQSNSLFAKNTVLEFTEQYKSPKT